MYEGSYLGFQGNEKSKQRQRNNKRVHKAQMEEATSTHFPQEKQRKSTN